MTLSQQQFESLKKKLIAKQQQPQPQGNMSFGDGYKENNPNPFNPFFSKDGEPRQQTKSSVPEKIADFTGGKELSQGLGQAAALGTNSKMLEETQVAQANLLDKALKTLREKKERGEDTTRLEQAIKVFGEEIGQTGAGAEELLNPNKLTNKQVIGDAIQLGTTIVGAGSLPGAAKNVVGAETLKTGLIQGAKLGAKTGAGFGGATGVAQGLQEDKDIQGIIKEGIKGAVIGGVGGAVVGGVMGGISGGVKGHQLRKEVLDAQIKSGEKSAVQLNKEAGQVLKNAQKQGIEENDINFVTSMSKADKDKARKMIALAEEASKNKRMLERPIDVVGDSMNERIKFIQGKNSTAGKAVDKTAKALKGKLVDATPVRERALSLLEDVGVTANPDGTPNWSKSIFNKTPELKNKIMKALSDLPAGEMDAYDLHNFKKSIDEVVNYGVGGEGLSGKSASILKAIRTTADDILDSSFSAYNQANTEYKLTREVLDSAEELFGKSGFGKERGGQLLRAVFSNNANRPRVMALVEQLDRTSQQFGKKFKDNLIDQALFTEILEDMYGTQATTALQGQVERAVHGTTRVIEGIRNPVKGALDIAASAAEKIANISPEQKRKALQALLK